MRNRTKAALDTARVEKDVENAYRAEISNHVPDVAWSSPHGSDGLAQWKASASTVRLLLEANFDQDLKAKLPVLSVLGQLLCYLKKFEQAGDVLPNVLFVGDKNECFVLATDAVRGFLSLDIDWAVAPSKGSPELTRALVSGFNLLPYVYDVDKDLDFGHVIAKIETLAAGARHEARATPTNLGAIFVYWRDRVFNDKSLTPTEQVDVFLRCLFQPTDVYLHPLKRGILVVPGYNEGVVVNSEQYRSFFDHFAQGYKPSEVESFYAMKDRLVEDDARRRQGAFFTPRLWVDEAHKELDRVLGRGWRKACVVWDPAAGTANLTRDHNDWGCLVSSTTERPDVAVMREHGWGGRVFQYDFLNPGVESPFFDTGDKNLIPDDVDKLLRAAAKAGKRLVFLMNPPYGTAGNTQTSEGGVHKAGMAATRVSDQMKTAKLGACSQQLYAQFMFRCATVAREYGFTDSTLATFSVPTFMSNGSYKPFRDWWYKGHEYQGGFLFQASHFADVSGRWGVSFTVWSSGGAVQTDSRATLPITLKDEQNFSVVTLATKTIYNADGREASTWVREPIKGLKGVDAPQFSSGLQFTERETARGSLVEGSLSYMVLMGNNLRDANDGTYTLSSTSSRGNGYSILPSNWRRSVALYGARKLVLETWDTQKDEYIRPDESKDGYEQWVDDCHVYTLLHRFNHGTAMRDVLYKGKNHRIKNHWFWRTRSSTLKALDSRDTLQLYKDCKAEPTVEADTNDIFGVLLGEDKPWEQTGDAYMAHVLPGLKISPDAQHVLCLLDALWLKSLPVRESYAAGKPDLHMMAWDAGLYQVKHLFRDLFPTEWKELQEAFKALSTRLAEGVYTYGFLLR